MTFLFPRDSLSTRLRDQGKRLTSNSIGRARLTVEWEAANAIDDYVHQVADLKKQVADQADVIRLLSAGSGLAADVVRLAKALTEAAIALDGAGDPHSARRAREAIASLTETPLENA